MTWGEIKAAAEEAGMTDESKLLYIDTDGCHGIHVWFDDKSDCWVIS